MIRWILFNPISLPKNRFLGCFSSCVFSLVGEPLMRIFNLIKSAYKHTARMAKITNLPNMTIIPRFRSHPPIAWLHSNPYGDLGYNPLLFIQHLAAHYSIKITLISFLGFITNFYPLPIFETLGYGHFQNFFVEGV